MKRLKKNAVRIRTIRRKVQATKRSLQGILKNLELGSAISVKDSKTLVESFISMCEVCEMLLDEQACGFFWSEVKKK